MATNLIVILEQTSSSPLGFRYALRATVPAARQSQYADASKTSQWKAAPAAEVADLQAGKIVERVEAQQWAPSTTVAAIKAALQVAQAAYQAEITGKNDWGFYGSTWDGTTWTNAGVA